MASRIQIKFNGLQFLKVIFISLMPKLAEYFNVSFFDNEAQQFFMSAIKSAINQRKESGQKRNDFLQLMLEARDGTLKIDEGDEITPFEVNSKIFDKLQTNLNTKEVLISDEGIAANAVLFILAGFDTIQSLLLFAEYSLAINKEVQDKLRKEIYLVLEDSEDGEFTYDSIKQMEYLDMVINEMLRFYPPAPMTDRCCTQEYKFPGTEMTIRKGEAVAISIFGIHHDEKYYPEPEKFIPERFSSENKATTHFSLLISTIWTRTTKLHWNEICFNRSKISDCATSTDF